MAGGLTVVLEAAAAAAAAMTGTPTCPFGCTTAVSPTPDMVRVVDYMLYLFLETLVLDQ
jgi:hypothetical protein